MEPESIEGRQFGIVLRGYDRQEVDDFAREVAEHLRQVRSELANVEAALEAAKSAPPPHPSPASAPAQPQKTDVYKQLGEETARILISAEQAANLIKEQAKREAAEVLADARRDAGRIARQAREGKQQAEGDLRQLLQTRAMLATQLEDVRRRLGEAVARLQAPLEPASPPPVIEGPPPDVLPSLADVTPQKPVSPQNFKEGVEGGSQAVGDPVRTGSADAGPADSHEPAGSQAPEPEEHPREEAAVASETARRARQLPAEIHAGHAARHSAVQGRTGSPAGAPSSRREAVTSRRELDEKASAGPAGPPGAQRDRTGADSAPAPSATTEGKSNVQGKDEGEKVSQPGRSLRETEATPSNPAASGADTRSSDKQRWPGVPEPGSNAMTPPPLTNGGGGKRQSSRDIVEQLLDEIREDSREISLDRSAEPRGPRVEHAPDGTSKSSGPVAFRSDSGDDQSHFFKDRADALGESSYEAARKLKRLLQEDHNDLLHRLRSQRGRGTLEENVAPEQEQLDRFNRALGQILRNAFAQGRRVAGAEGEGESGDSLGALVARQVVLPLRGDLCKVVETGLAAKDTPSAISERASDVFRIWKGVRTELLGEGLVLAAFHQGVLDAWKGKRDGTKRWVLSPDEQECPKGVCKANASEGPVPVGSQFSSGHISPPAHGGCTCGLQPR